MGHICTEGDLGDLRALRILMYLLSKECSDLGRNETCALVGSAAVGEGAIIGISLDVTSPVIYTDPALAKNCFAHLLRSVELFRWSHK